MGRINPKVVFTPGSRPTLKKATLKKDNKRGRPKKKHIKERGSPSQKKENVLINAINAMEQDNLTIREAAEMFAAPKSTLYDRPVIYIGNRYILYLPSSPRPRRRNSPKKK